MSNLHEDLRRWAAEQQTHRRAVGMDAITPGALFHLGCKNPLVKACLVEWELGHLRWDEMLTWLVVHLAAQVERLEQNAVVQLQREPPKPIILDRPPSP
jgi:hypothetical protein